jgi:hypothetical protein
MLRRILMKPVWRLSRTSFSSHAPSTKGLFQTPVADGHLKKPGAGLQAVTADCRQQSDDHALRGALAVWFQRDTRGRSLKKLWNVVV